MLASAETAFARVPAGLRPPRGTGPLGAGDGQRWITADDVLAWNANVDVAPDRDAYAVSALGSVVDARPRGAPTLYDYQTECVRACEGRSGLVHMECGTGKSVVAAELVRRAGGTAVILAQHSVSVEQWVTHLQRAGVVAAPLRVVGRAWRVTNDPLPRAVVATYHGAVRAVRAVHAHRARVATGTPTGDDDPHVHRLVALLLCTPLAILVLDEVHAVVADVFLLACTFPARHLLGLSGSLVREDDRIRDLARLVGPVLFEHGTEREHRVVVVTAPLDARVRAASARTEGAQTLRALAPPKVAALAAVLARHASERVLVFCDTVRAAQILAATTLSGRCRLVHGESDRDERRDALAVFAAAPPGSLVLLCTRVCDASIDFPPGCVVVQHHLTSGSRQQEVQRCGRGTRDVGTGGVVYHLVTAETEEVEYSERRIEHLASEMWGTVHVERVDAPPCNDDPTHFVPMARACVVSLAEREAEAARVHRARALRRRQRRQRLLGTKI